MRDIIFKAKRLSNGEWIEGWYFQKPNPLTQDGMPIKYCISDFPPFGAEIDPETVCQYTGLKNKEGRRIFEGDRVLYRFSGVDSYGVVLFGIYGDQSGRYDQGFYIRWEEDADCLRNDLGFWTTEREIEVVGNIHDTEKEREGAKDGKADPV